MERTAPDPAGAAAGGEAGILGRPANGVATVAPGARRPLVFGWAMAVEGGRDEAMVRLCARLSGGRWVDALGAAQAAGLRDVAFALPADEGPSEDRAEAGAAAIGRRFRDEGVRIAMVEADVDLRDPEPEAGRRAVERLRRLLALTAEVGADALATAGGGPAASGAPAVALPGRDPLDRVAEALRLALEESSEGGPGVGLLLHTRAGAAADSLLRAAEAVRRVAHPAFGLFFDPVELITLDTYHDNGSFLRRSARQLGGALRACAGRDVLLRPEGFAYRLQEVALGRGALDYPGLLAALDARPEAVDLCVGGPTIEDVVAAAQAGRAALARAAGQR